MLSEILGKISFRHTIKIIIRSLITLLIILILMLSLLAIALSTERGRLWVAHMAIDYVNQSTNLHITVSQLKTPAWGEWQMQSLQIDQGETSPWLITKNLELKWQPGALMDKRIIVDELSASTLSLHQLPASKDQPTEDTQTDLLAAIAEIDIPEIQLKKLALEKFSLHDFYASPSDKQILNYRTLSYRINAAIDWLENSPLQLNLNATGLNTNPVEIALQIESNQLNRATIKGTLKEPKAGFFGNLLQLPDSQAIDAKFAINISKKNQLGDNHFNITIDELNFPLTHRKISAQGGVMLIFTKLKRNQAENPAAHYPNIYLQDLALGVDETRHTIDGSWLDNQFNVKLNLDQLPLDILGPWQSAITENLANKPTANSQTIDKAAINSAITKTKLTTQLTLTGTLEQPQVSASLSVKTIYQKFPIAVDFKGSANKQKIMIEQLKTSIDRTLINAKGDLDLLANNTSLNVSVNHFNLKILDAFNIARPPELTDTVVSAKAKLSGSITSLNALNGELSFTTQGNYQTQIFSVDGELSKKANDLVIKKAALTLNGNHVSAQGDIKVDSLDANLTVNAQAIPLNLLELAQVELPAGLSGQLETQLKLTGNLRKPQIEGNAKLQGVYDDIPFDFVADGHFYNNNILIKQLTLDAYGNNVLTASGQYQTEKIDINLQADKLPTKLLSAMGFRVQPGDFSAQLRAHGNLQSPELIGNINYETQLNRYKQGEKLQPVLFNWILDITTEQQTFNFKSAVRRDNNPPSELLLSIPKQPYLDYLATQNAQSSTAQSNELPLRASITGRLNLQLITFLIDADSQQLKGELTTDIDLSGNFASPKINGNMQLQDSRYEHFISGTVIEAINCNIQAQQTTLQINNCQATDGGKGNFNLTGKMQLPVNKSAGLIDLNVAAQKVSLLKRPDFESEISGDIALSGNFDAMLASGKLDLTPLTILIDSPLSSGIPTLKVEEVKSFKTANTDSSENTDEDQQTAIPEVKLDVTLIADQQAYLRGRGVDAELQGKIAVYGTLANPRYDGEIKTIRGVFELFNKSFELESGRVNFTNNAITLAISSVYKKNEQQIRAELSGTVDQLKLSLSAIPSLPEDEILAFIIFGKSIKKITPFEAVQLASAVQQLRGGNNSFDLIGGTRKFLGVDALSIESADEGVNVGVGKYLNERVYLELERTPNPSQPWKGNLQIELTPDLSLESSTGGESGIEGVELKWKKDY